MSYTSRYRFIRPYGEVATRRSELGSTKHTLLLQQGVPWHTLLSIFKIYGYSQDLAVIY